MAWPTDNISTTNMDAGGDSAATARADLYNLALRVKDIIAGRGTANGVASLDAGVHVPVAQIPALSYLPTTGGTVSGGTAFSSTLGISGTLTTAAINASGNITATSGYISTSANYIQAIKNSQTDYSSSALRSVSESGNSGVSIHCSGSSATFLQHARGGNGISVLDASNNPADIQSRRAIATYNSQTAYSSAGIVSISASGDCFVGLFPSGGGTAAALKCVRGGNGLHVLDAGNGYTSITASSFPIGSDKRLKEHECAIGDDESGSVIDALEPVWFRWKNTGMRDVGHYAQDAYIINPVLAIQPENENEWWKLRQDRIIPFLVRQIQSLRRRVAALESK